MIGAGAAPAAAGDGPVPLDRAAAFSDARVMDDALRRSVCRLIAGLVVADDDLDDAESELLDRMLVKFGIPLEERDALFPLVDCSEAAEAMRGLPPDVQREALDLLIDATVADGKIVKAERAYLAAVGDAVGIAAAEIDAKLAAALPG